MLNTPELVKNYYQCNNATQQLRLNFYLKVLIYTFYKKYLEKPRIASLTDLALSMARTAIRLFSCQSHRLPSWFPPVYRIFVTLASCF